MRPWSKGGWTDGRKDGRTSRNSPLCSTSALWGCCPKRGPTDQPNDQPPDQLMEQQSGVYRVPCTAHRLGQCVRPCLDGIAILKIQMRFSNRVNNASLAYRNRRRVSVGSAKNTQFLSEILRWRHPKYAKMGKTDSKQWQQMWQKNIQEMYLGSGFF